MANWLNNLGTGLGNALIGVNNPFGLAPPEGFDRNAAMRQGALSLGMSVLANADQNPAVALGRGYRQAQAIASDNQQNAMAAEAMMAAAEEKRRKRQEEEESKAQFEQFVSTLPPDQQPLARMFPEKYGAAVIGQKFPDPQGAGGQYFGTPIPYDMGGGRIGYGLPSKDGTFKPLDAPNGGAFLGPYDKAFLTSSGTTRGKITTEQEMSAPSDLAAAEEAIGILEQITAHPALELGTGFSSYGNAVRGTPGYDFQNLVEQAKSGAFLTAIDQLKGMGALSNMEGQAATAAVTRMDTATSKEAFLKAVSDYRSIVERGAAKARSKITGAAPSDAADDPLGLR